MSYISRSTISSKVLSSFGSYDMKAFHKNILSSTAFCLNEWLENRRNASSRIGVLTEHDSMYQGSIGVSINSSICIASSGQWYSRKGLVSQERYENSLFLSKILMNHHSYHTHIMLLSVCTVLFDYSILENFGINVEPVGFLSSNIKCSQNNM